MPRDAQKDPEIFPEALHAKALINQVDRKLVKQTVMTSVYCVTYIGARDQIKRILKDRGLLEEAEIYGASCYAAKVTLTALGEMFEAPRSIMNWFGECAKGVLVRRVVGQVNNAGVTGSLIKPEGKESQI